MGSAGSRCVYLKVRKGSSTMQTNNPPNETHTPPMKTSQPAAAPAERVRAESNWVSPPTLDKAPQLDWILLAPTRLPRASVQGQLGLEAAAYSRSVSCLPLPRLITHQERK